MFARPNAHALFVFLFAWCLISLWLYRANMALLPSGHHAWAMSDYYAMALRFPENGFDLFHPTTYSLHTKEGITASDLPLPAWLSAACMAVFRTESPFVFRFLTWCAGLFGLFCFFMTLRTGGVNSWRAVVLTLLFGLLPCWAYYHNSMMPSPWAFSAFLFGLWMLGRCEKHRNSSTLTTGPLLWMMAGFLLAALLRKPFVLYFALLALWLWQGQKGRKAWLIWGAGMIVFAGWQWHDYQASQHYGSIFLRNTMPAASLSEAGALALAAWKKWGLVWLSPVHWAWLGLGAILGILLKKRPFRQQRTIFSGLLLPVGFLLAGCAYFFLMLRQFADHDYYFIDAFYPALFAGAAFLAVHTEARKNIVWAELLLLVAALWQAGGKQAWYWDMARFPAQEKTNRAYCESRPLLDSLKVPATARMLVFEAYSENAPLVGMRREGWCLKTSRYTAVNEHLLLPFDYAVCLDTFFAQDVLDENPALAQRLEYVGGNNALMVFRPAAKPNNNIETLFGQTMTTLMDTALVKPGNGEFLFTRSLPPLPGQKILFYGSGALDQPGSLKATVSLFKSGAQVAIVEKTLYFAQGDVEIFRCAAVNVPAVAADEMRIYLWNPERKHVVFKGFKIVMARNTFILK